MGPMGSTFRECRFITVIGNQRNFRVTDYSLNITRVVSWPLIRDILFVTVEPKSEQLLAERSRELGTTAEMLSQSKQVDTIELASAQRLQFVATQMINVHGTEALYEQILDTLTAVLHSDFASIQMLYPERGRYGELRLLGHRGFSREAFERWEWVRPDTRTTCGEALRTGRRVAVPDVRNCEFMSGSVDLEGYLSGGIRAVQSTPLVSRSGCLMGMVSTHWRDIHEMSSGELCTLDVLARMAADLIERSRAEEKARESEERLRFAQETADIGTFDIDLGSGLMTWTPKLERMYGIPPESGFQGTRAEWLALIHPDDRDRVARRRIESLESDAPVEEEWRVIWPDQSIHWLAGRWKAFKNAEGKPVRLMGVNIDITGRKQMEQALRDNEERSRNIANAAPVMIWMSGSDKLRTFVNEPWLAFAGTTMEQQLGDGWLSGVHPEDQGRCGANYSSSFDARHSFQMEYRVRRADGEYRWVLDNGRPHYRENEFAGYIGCCIDITEQKGVEERLRSSQARLMDSQRLANVGSWDRDVATGRVHWSDQMCRIFGLPDNTQPVFLTFLSLVHPKDLGIIEDVEKRAVAAESPIVAEYRIIRPDGQVRFIRSISEVVKNEQGAPVRFVGTDQDITEQVKATELLRESEARLKSAERMAHVGNWIWDIKAKRVSCSEEMRRILGYPEDYEPSYEEAFQMIAPEDRERAEEWVGTCLTKKRGSRIEVRILRPGGDMGTVVCRSELLLDDDGSPARMFGTCQDVTDARRAEEDAFARQKLESLGTLASGIAHDFNNLLGAMLAQAELATAELASGSDADDELKQIREVAIRGSEIVRQLMIYAGKEGDVVELTDVSKAIEDMLGLLRVSVSRHATIVTDLAESLPAVKARPAQLRQIVLNLVVNASDAIRDREGIIRVTTRCVTFDRDAGLATSDYLAPGDYVKMEVSDTGTGMSPETKSRMFDPFFTTKSAGRGLGLAVVYGVVRSLNGAIRVISEFGNGATFQILLPCAGAAGCATADTITTADEVSRHSRGATVLVVEDEHPLRLAITKMLDKAGFKVIQVANGSDAIELLRGDAVEIDAILLDMTIPGATSQEVLAEAVQIRPSTKIIATSAYSEETARMVLNGLQIGGFVRKPFQFEQLVRTLRSVLSSNSKA
jgi:PAS domain S-box-containing protein